MGSMFNLLLLDDELSTLEGLYNNIDWHDIGINEVYKADHASKALDILKNNRVDIVITDIRMPDINGIEISSIIEKKWPHTKVILLSGFMEFDYAKKAMDFGVFSYIAKPAGYEEIIINVKNAIARIEEDLRKINIVEEARKKISLATTVLQEHFLLSWIFYGKKNPVKNAREFNECNLQIDTNGYGLLLVIRIDDYAEQPLFDSVLLQMTIKDLAYEILGRNQNMLVFFDIEDNGIILIHEKDLAEMESKSKYIKSMLDAFQLAVKNTTGYLVSIFWGEILPVLDMNESYKNLIFRSNNRIAYSHGTIMGFQDHGQIAVCAGLYKYPNINMLVDSMQKDETIIRIEQIFAEIIQKSLQNTDALIEVYHVVVGAIISDSIKRNLKLSQWGTGLNDFLTNMNIILSLSEFRSKCIILVMQYFDYVIHTETKKTSNMVNRIKSHIVENLKENISVTLIANSFNYNSSYLSKLFKKETGMAIQDYIIRVRIDKAKDLLREPGSKVYEVSEKVGYENIPHFSRLFKKLTGISPKEYQNS